MHYSLITLIGNDQKLKDTIYLKCLGLSEEQIPIPYPYQVIFTTHQQNSIRFSIMNTPSTIYKDDLISIWNNMLSVSKMENYEYCVVIYCFTDTQTDLSQLLTDLHTQTGCQNNQQDIILLTQKESLKYQLEKNNNLQVIVIDRYQIQQILPQIAKSKQLKQSNLKPIIQQQQNAKEIANDKFDEIFQEWKVMIKQSRTHADFIKNVLQEQQISQIAEKLQVDFQSQVQQFNFLVNLRVIFEKRISDFLDHQLLKHQAKSSFRYCSTNTCTYIYEIYSQCLKQLYKIDIRLDKPLASNNYCNICQKNTFYISYEVILKNVYQEFEFRILNELSQTYQQQDSKEILQIMFLSTNEEEKTKIFQIIQQNYSTDQPKKCNKFDRGSIINNKFRFHNPPLFDFEKNNQNTITTFKDYFCKNDIHFFFIIIKFERTDIIIQRLTNIIKRIHHLDRKRMALIVSQCEQEQKAELENNLGYFHFQTIHFVSNDYPLNICNTIFKTLENVDTQKFDFTNTIFEQEIESSEEKLLNENLQEMKRKIESEEMNKIKKQQAQDKELKDQLEMEIKKLEEQLSQRKAEYRNISEKIIQDQQKLNDLERYDIKFKH